MHWFASRIYFPIRAGAIVLCLLFCDFAQAENWPSWRGPRQDGTSLEIGLPVKWNKTENVLWRTPLPGPAASTPVVWGNRIFLTSVEGEALILLCIATDGKILWKRSAGTGNKKARTDEGNFAAPSPVTDGHHVWAFFGSGDLTCFDFDGNQIWKTNLAERYGKFNLYFVMASTPLLLKDRLYVQLIHSDASIVLALQKANGREVWKQERRSDARDECKHSYASPVLYGDDKRKYLLIHGADYITAHRLEDGSEIWRCGGLNPPESYNPSLRLVATPVALPGLIVVPSAKNGPVLGLKPDGSGDITRAKDQYQWRLSQGTPDVPSPLVQNGLVYLCRENGDLNVVDARSGESIYLEHTFRGRHRASPVYADGKIYLTARDGVVTVVKAGRKFEILSQNNIGETISASPAISSGIIYIRSYEALYAISSPGQ